MDYADVGFFAVRYLLENYPQRLMQRYEMEALPESEIEAIEAIGRKRGCLSKNQKVDIDRASRILVRELRSGQLGRLTLESPSSMKRERAETEKAIAEKEAKMAEKDAKRKKRFRDKQRAQRKSREMN